MLQDTAPETEMIMVPRPRTLLKLLMDVLVLRTRRLMAYDRGNTMAEVTLALRGTSLPGAVVSREPDGGMWSVTFSPAADPTQPVSVKPV